jgi:predicted secreted protein
MAALESLEVTSVAPPHLGTLADRTQKTVNLASTPLSTTTTRPAPRWRAKVAPGGLPPPAEDGVVLDVAGDRHSVAGFGISEP